MGPVDSGAIQRSCALRVLKYNCMNGLVTIVWCTFKFLERDWCSSQSYGPAYGDHSGAIELTLHLGFNLSGDTVGTLAIKQVQHVMGWRIVNVCPKS